MSVAYVPVQWNRSKWVYDAVLLAAIALYIAAFLHLGDGWSEQTRPTDGWILRARAFGTCAFFLLTVILCVGPLARLDRRFLPLLYNRRHAGVLTCVVAIIHFQAVFAWYFNFTAIDRHAALLAANGAYDMALGFPFESLGLFALICLLILAATSHDFWLSFLTPPVWKRLHLLLYAAYAAVVAHVMLGAFQSATSPVFGAVVGACALLVAGLHALAWARERPGDAPAGGMVAVPDPQTIIEGRARVVALPDGGRAAVWRHEGRLYATSNACAHQNGPLGEGRILDGCVTCPWHGFQYRVQDGCAPAPFTERIPTYALRREGGRVMLDPEPRAPGDAPPGLPLEPAP